MVFGSSVYQLMNAGNFRLQFFVASHPVRWTRDVLKTKDVGVILATQFDNPPEPRLNNRCHGWLPAI